jgi:hypothetical protein
MNFNIDNNKINSALGIITALMNGVESVGSNIPGDIKKQLVKSILTELYNQADNKFNLPDWVDSLAESLINIVYDISVKDKG